MPLVTLYVLLLPRAIHPNVVYRKYMDSSLAFPCLHQFAVFQRPTMQFTCNYGLCMMGVHVVPVLQIQH